VSRGTAGAGAAPSIRIVADPTAAAALAADLTAAWLADAVAGRGRADWATTGGSAPIGMYRDLMRPPRSAAVPWQDVHVWWGDDRFVHRDHPLSNVKPLDDILLGIGRTEEGTAGGAVEVPFPAANLHPFPTGEAIGRGLGADWCAAQLADTLRSDGPEMVDGWPAFDVLMLGVGSDGHVLSVFPGSAALDAPELCLAIPAPTHIEPHVERVTMNPAVIGRARRVLVVVTGDGKAAALAGVFGTELDPRRWPAQLARIPTATWILDEAAAAGLPD
jgi:6-phosphogluconolactonase